MILGTAAISQAIEDGAIVCDPGPAKVEGAHIDIRLGTHYWEFDSKNSLHCVNTGAACTAIDLTTDPWFYFIECAALDKVIIPPRGFILAHTAEYIGTAPGSGLVPMLHTRSTLARWGLSACTANAGQGDAGYISRWTLEIVNPHAVAVAIPVGARVGSISFHRVEGAATPYIPGTRYNTIKAEWTPESMLPNRGNW